MEYRPSKPLQTTPEASPRIPEAPITQPEKSPTEPLSPEHAEERKGEPPTEEAGAIAHAISSVRQALSKPKKKPQAIPQAKDALLQSVETIMQENLEDAYRALSTVEQQEFKTKGEETARAIRMLLRKTRVKIKKIFRLLLNWLLVLPGINRFYLEQEAKIKADKILALKYWERNEHE